MYEIPKIWYEKLISINDTAILVSLSLIDNMSLGLKEKIIATGNEEAIEHLTNQ